jgi:pyrroline-5-carboxylate reductase
MELGLIGAGNMASALARGIGEPVLVADVDAAKAERLAEATGGEALGSNAEVAERADVVLLCHKPWQLDEVAAEVAPSAKAIASVLAGVKLAQLEEAYPDRPVLRLMPNLPVEHGAGVICHAGSADPALLELLGRAGLVIAVEEPELEPAMAVMSCGPAFMALIAESLAAAGASHGLNEAQARRMVIETMAGSATWLSRHEDDTADLRVRVATPGGLTEKGLKTLEREGLPDALTAAVDEIVEAVR